MSINTQSLCQEDLTIMAQAVGGKVLSRERKGLLYCFFVAVYEASTLLVNSGCLFVTSVVSALAVFRITQDTGRLMLFLGLGITFQAHIVVSAFSSL